MTSFADSQDSAAHKASQLLHHLLNQTLSGLDFCILWQELVDDNPSLQNVHSLVDQFLAEADLGALDQALALLPIPQTESPEPLEAARQVAYDGWSVSSQRQRETSRADFRCESCGFEITIAQEHPPNTEMRLPFDHFVCPVCEEN